MKKILKSLPFKLLVGVIVGAILLKEHLSLAKISGLVAMVAGVLLIAFAH